MNKDQKVRSVTIGLPSRTAYLTLWEDTEDEETFPIKYVRSNYPYVTAYGIKYYLSDKEIKILRLMLNL